MPRRHTCARMSCSMPACALAAATRLVCSLPSLEPAVSQMPLGAGKNTHRGVQQHTHRQHLSTGCCLACKHTGLHPASQTSSMQLLVNRIHPAVTSHSQQQPQT